MFASSLMTLALAHGAVDAQGVRTDPPGTTNGPGGTPSSGLRYAPTPWYGERGVRNQLKLTDEQYQRLHQGYGTAYSGIAPPTATDLTEQQRQERMQQNYATFYKNLDTSTRQVLTPEQQNRYNQLWMQYRGYDAVLDPTTREKLKLTDAQVQLLNKYNTEYHRQYGNLVSQYGKNPKDANTAYNELNPYVGNRISSVFDENQRRQWTDMTGAPYRFEPFYGYANPTK